MIEKKSKDNIINRCKFCGWKFPNDLVEKINENSDSLFCELCGAEIRHSNAKNQEKDEKIESKCNNDLSGSADKSKSSPWKRFYETIKRFVMETEGGEVQKGLKKKQKESIARVFNDNDFPKIFRENFIIVFSRITYSMINNLNSTSNLKNSKMKLTKTVLDEIRESVKPIINMQIKDKFLRKLHKITLDDFETYLKKLQSKLQSDQDYHNDFIIYLQWLISIVFKLISEMWDMENLPKFEETILKDLKNYSFNKFSGYEKYLNLGDSREDLDFDMTKKEFEETMRNRGSVRPSWVKVRWRCTKYGHTWMALYHNIKQGTGCPICPRKTAINYEDYMVLGNSRDDLDIDMSQEEFYKAIDNRENTLPSDIKLRWKCFAKNHTWYASYHSIKQGTGCSHCPKGPKVITYKKCIDLGDSRDELSLDMTREEFFEAIEERGLKRPSFVKLRWRCLKYGHIWLASYHHIYMGKGCPYCFMTSYEKCVELGNSRDDLSFNMTQEEFNDILKNRGNNTPNAAPLRWQCSIKSEHIWFASYNSIDRGTGCPFCGKRARIIGQQTHPIIEYFNLKYLKTWNCKVEHEVEIDPNRKFRADLLIDRNSNFKKNIEQYQQVVQFPNKIRKVSIDFTFSLDPDKILKKCFKKYQNKERFLLIVLMWEQKGRTAKVFQQLIETEKNIFEKKHINVLNFNDYLRFLNLFRELDKWRVISNIEKEILSKLLWIRELGINSFESDLSLNKLIKAGKYYRNLLT